MLLVSNRLPVSIEKRRGNLVFHSSVGGLATGLGAVYKLYGGLWVGWPGAPSEKVKGEEDYVKTRLLRDGFYPVFLSKSFVDRYYYGFSNRTIWPLFHYFTQYVVYNREFWDAYKRVNERFSEAVLEVAKGDDVIWIHDYHLMLLPKLIRDELPDAAIGFFLHIPFPSFEIFRLLPWRKEILEGLLGADLIGFHDYDYASHFLTSTRRLLGYEYTLNQLVIDGRVVKVDAFPMGIDYTRYSNAPQLTEVRRRIAKFRRELGDCKVIFSIDRLDYTKGVPQRLEAFDLFLDRYPEYREKITLVLVVVPSRANLVHYRELKRRIDELVGEINGKHGTISWSPIKYIYAYLPFSSLVALYSIADVALITPLRDGMNLVAKEFVAAKKDDAGVLILSEMAGAVKELGEAIIVNPNNMEEIAEALREALTMSKEEKIERIRRMQRRLQRYNIIRWSEEFMDRLENTRELQRKMMVKILTDEVRRRLIADYCASKSRLLLLDYDGTLVNIFPRLEDAKPNESLLNLIKSLSEVSGNEVVIISGRDKQTLERWFTGLNIGLVAEHGVWVKKGDKWGAIKPLSADWKEDIRPILELYVDRTPGAFIEEKEMSLAWHYRRVEPELAAMRARELIDNLIELTANFNINILEGDKVIEIKDADVDKGWAALKWLSDRKWEFILAAGDDYTDEDIFRVLPENAYSIKVGLSPTKAKYNLVSYKEVVSLLKELVECNLKNST
ncbi:MAG: bifunctional alpha,alpha-trehalose-phosphate synthase (UDP-forming)/trehalose-phosphatase [Candidatus Odinarchaeia archaeon]